jgi:hypothetical protein
MANNIKYIFMNFLGLAFYPAFYGLLAAKIPIYKLLRVVLYAATIYFIYGGYLLLESVLFDKYLINAALSVSDYRVLYLAQTLYLVPFISIGLLKISGVISLNEFYWRGLSLPAWSITNLFIISSLLIVVFLSMSKAFIGIIIILLVLTFLLALMKFLYGANLRPFIFIVLTMKVVIWFEMSNLD